MLFRSRDKECAPGAEGCVLKGKYMMTPAAGSQVRGDGDLQSRRDLLIAAMKEIFEQDTRRIDHAMQVLGFAEEILNTEPANREVVVAAAILHDIGIPAAERKHQSAAGHLQEIEGPPIARDIMCKLQLDDELVDHVCRIIANHHSARDIDTVEFRIIWDADWLVNLPYVYRNLTPSQTERKIELIFKTVAGARLARERYVKGQQ